MENKPLSPHIQIYKWHISSLVSISHRITGIINILAITLICFWFALILLGESNYEIIKLFLQTFVGKFILIGITWSFSFQMLSEIRHLIMDLGYGFDLQTTKITGLLVIFGSLILTILIYLIGRGLN
jgi:succinate dehydrogenase / fumarate reductase cytochrome b subunit|tara:strand:+ start:634 stop:1014 length:381 start_codon:yes stop_codon:yes gene_type:complete